jgi:ligand-binding sensor domain-containing protein/serine phosphatase RsbU (regulator of sigma subunit)
MHTISILIEKIIRPIRRIIFFISLVLPVQGFSQNYFFDNYGVAEGLSQSTVFDILQDYNDYVWMGTRAGVSRFDGIQFINYTMEDGLAENGVRVLFMDARNNIWCGHSGGGISIFDGQKFKVFSEPGTVFSSDITSITNDAGGNIWITSELSGAVRISRMGSTLEDSEKELYIGNTLSDRIFGAYLGKNGVMYFITDAFIKVYNAADNQFTGYSADGMPSFFLITTLFEDSKNNLWFGTYHGGLYKFRAERDSFVVYDIRDGLASNWISTISEDRAGNIWAGTWGGGLTRIGADGLKTFNQKNGLPDLMVRKIMEDREGNILIGTNEHGLSIFKGEQFVYFNVEDGLSDPQVWAIEQDRSGRFWFGTNSGITLYDPSKPESSAFSNFYKLQGERIRFIKEDTKGRIWIATDNQGIFTMNSANGSFSYEPRLNSWLSKLLVTALETDAKGNVWAGTLDGLVGYDYDSRTAGYYTQTSGLAGNEITSVYSDPKGRLWVGTRSGGLSLMEKDSFRIFSLEDDFTAKTIVMDQKGMLWVGTEARGVLMIDPEQQKIIRQFKESDGLLANLINLVETDNEGNIYVGTNKGLNIYRPQEDKVYSFTQRVGFVGIETKTNSVVKDRKGMLWFGTVAGVTRFNPLITDVPNKEPLTHIISFKVNLQERPMEAGLRLNYKEKDIIFDYISICLTNPEAVRYQIMLQGAETDWRPVTTQASVTYPALAPKKYVFMVRAQNSDGFWNETPIEYAFQIKPPFYKTWWFILICIVAGVAAIISYIKIRERNLLEEKRILEEKVAERTAEVVAQKEELAEKNKDITDSIRYAKRIQFAMLPEEIPFKDTFILFKPKDIVSGDFYWLDTIGDKEFIAACDCTGHGVPGAFMSIIGANSLNKIVREQGVYEPGKILERLNIEVINSLKRSDDGTAIMDGMDLALYSFNRKTMELEFAGGFNPLVLIRNNEIEELKADRHSIGRSSSDEKKVFTNHRITVQPGDAAYIFSDGYADQFGGDTGKKFKYKPMKELFLAIYEKPMEEQKIILNETLEAWRGEIAQVDDVLVIGRRF